MMCTEMHKYEFEPKWMLSWALVRDDVTLN